jgi:hypothetical protein
MNNKQLRNPCFTLSVYSNFGENKTGGGPLLQTSAPTQDGTYKPSTAQNICKNKF